MDDGEAEVPYEAVAWTRGRRTYERIPDSIDSDNVLPYSVLLSPPRSVSRAEQQQPPQWIFGERASKRRKRAGKSCRPSEFNRGQKQGVMVPRQTLYQRMRSNAAPTRLGLQHPFVVDRLVSVGDAWLWVWGRGGGIVKWRGEVCTFFSHAALQLVLVQVG